ncbi:hypothetical protein AB0L86_22430 [Micromonospora musae]|uniref:hypothetical protein n=1 Tax=Micromonospora musae TaxID=1894970 RepID=UPI00341260CC
MNLPDLCLNLRRRRRMYLLDDRYSTAVAFVEGYNAAFDGDPLSGFQDYVAARILNRKSSLHWSYVIASTKMPALLDSDARIDQIPAELEVELTDLLVDLLEEFALQGGGSAD